MGPREVGGPEGEEFASRTKGSTKPKQGPPGPTGLPPSSQAIHYPQNGPMDQPWSPEVLQTREVFRDQNFGRGPVKRSNLGLILTTVPCIPKFKMWVPRKLFYFKPRDPPPPASVKHSRNWAYIFSLVRR